MGLLKKKLKSGLIGCGHFARIAYTPAFNMRSNPIACSGLYSRNIKSSELLRDNLRYKPEVFTSHEELFASGIDCVIIATPNYSHKYFIIEALKNNLNVFCEKPVTNTLKDALDLMLTLKNSGSILMVGYNRRYLATVQRLKKLINGGAIGKINEVFAFHNQDIKGHLLKSDWLNDAEKSGGGVLHNAGTHLINVMLYLFGKINNVSAEFRNIEMPVAFSEDTAVCRFVFQSGVVGTLKASWVKAVDSAYEHIVVKGEKGDITSDIWADSIAIQYHSKKIKKIHCRKGTPADSIYNELVHFYNCIRLKKTPDTDIKDSIETLKVTDAARISAMTSREIRID